MASPKCELQAQAIMENLNLRLASSSYPNPVTKSYSSGNILLSITAAGDTGPECLILLAPVDPISSGLTDALGLTQNTYSPHKISVLFDIAADDATEGATPLLQFNILGELFRTGMELDLYFIDAEATHTLVVGDITSANYKGTFQNLQFGMSASV